MEGMVDIPQIWSWGKYLPKEKLVLKGKKFEFLNIFGTTGLKTEMKMD